MPAPDPAIDPPPGPEYEPGAAFHPEIGLLLFGLAMLLFGVYGLATGNAILFLPGGAAPPSNTTAWTIGDPGARLAAAGQIVFGIGAIGWWRRGNQNRWSLRSVIAGVMLVLLGHLMAGLVRLAPW